MPSFSKMLVFCIVLFGLPACTVYTEKQTEAVSKVVYATKDSIDGARFDLADEYITEATRLIRPPKNKIPIHSMNESNKSAPKDKKINPTVSSKTPVIIVPERLRGLKVVVVNSEEYNLLIQSKESHKQLKSDYANLELAKKLVDEELTTQSHNRDKMLREINILKESISNKNIAILKLSIACGALSIGLIGVAVLKIKGIL